MNRKDNFAGKVYTNRDGGNLGTAAIYARRSDKESKKDREDKELKIESTIKTQTEACMALARERGFRIANDSVFQEYFTGAELWDRPLLTELRARVRERQYSALICYSTDRLARDPIHIAILADECDRHGCALIFVTEPLDTSPEANLIRYVRGYAAQLEREKIKERVMRQRTEIINSGHMICSGAPKYGYLWDKKNRCRVVNEKTAPVVYNIFKSMLNGLSGRVIAERLNAARVPTPSVEHGRAFKDERATPIWNNSTISRILKDESYTGKTYVSIHKTTKVRRKDGTFKSVVKDQAEWKLLPDGITPPIITEDTFRQVRALVEANKTKADHTRNSLRPYLLRGLIFCTGCGNPMYPEVEQIRVMRNRVRYVVGHKSIYRCSHGFKKLNRLNPKIKCPGGRVYAEEVEAAVWDKVISFLNDPQLIAAEVEKLIEEMPEDHLDDDLAGAELQLTKVGRVRAKLVERWKEALANDDDDLAERLDRDITSQADDIRALKGVIEDLRRRKEAHADTAGIADRFQEYCARLADGMKGEFTFEEKVAALTALQVKVYTACGSKIKLRLTAGVVSQLSRDLPHNFTPPTIELEDVA